MKSVLDNKQWLLSLLLHLCLACFVFPIAIVSLSFALQSAPKITDVEYRQYVETSDDFRIAEKELTSVYKELLSTLPPDEKASLKRNQREWLRSRDENVFKMATKGSAAYIEALIKITNERIAWLRSKLSNSSDTVTMNQHIEEQTQQVKATVTQRAAEAASGDVPAGLNTNDSGPNAIRTVVNTGHLQNIRKIVFNHDESFMASLDDAGTIKVWQMSTGRLLRAFEKMTSLLEDFSFDQNNNLITIILEKEYPAGPYTESIVTGGEQTYWDLSTGNKIRVTRPQYLSENIISKSADGLVVVTEHSSTESNKQPGTVNLNIWNISKESLVRQITMPGDKCFSCVISSDRNTLACMTITGRKVHLGIYKIDDGSLINTSSFTLQDSYFELIEKKTQEDDMANQSGPPVLRYLFKRKFKEEEFFGLNAVSPEGKFIAFYSKEVSSPLKKDDDDHFDLKADEILVLRTKDMATLMTTPFRSLLHIGVPPIFFSSNAKIMAVPEDPLVKVKWAKGKRLNVDGDAKHATLRVMDISDQAKAKALLAVDPGQIHFSTYWCYALSPSGRYFVVGEGDVQGSGISYQGYRLLVNDIRIQTKKFMTEGHAPWTTGHALSPDGKFLAIKQESLALNQEGGEDHYISRLYVIDLAVGQKILEVKNDGQYSDISVSRNNVLAIPEFDSDESDPDEFTDSIAVRKLPSGDLIAKIPFRYTKWHRGFALSPDGNFIAVATFEGEVDADHPNFVIDIFKVSDKTLQFRIPDDDKRDPNSNVFMVVDFSPDNKYLAQHINGVIKLWDLRKKAVIRSLKAERFINILKFSEDGKLLLGVYNPPYRGWAETSNVWRVSDGKLMASVKSLSELPSLGLGSFVVDNISLTKGIRANGVTDSDAIEDLKTKKTRVSFYNGENYFVAVTPEGFFSGSGDFSRYVHFVKGTTAYEFNQFYDVFYRPDLVEKKLKGEDLTEYTGTLSIEEALKSPPPKVTIVSPEREAHFSEAKVTARVRIDDAGGGIGDARIYHNGKLIYSSGIYRIAKTEGESKISDAKSENPYKIASRGVTAVNIKFQPDQSQPIAQMVETPSSKGTIEKSYEINLVRGKNVISVSAFNGTNTVMSSMETVEIDADIPARRPQLFAVVIGNNSFKDKKYDLSLPAKDAEDFAALLERDAKPLFQDVHVSRMTNTSKGDVVRTFNDMAKQMNPEDVFVLFVASHGIAHDDIYYIMTSDFDGNVNSKAGSISSVELMELSKNIPALKQMYVLDTCQSGGIGAIVSGLYDARISVIAKALGMHILAAAKTHQGAIDKYKDNGLFTYFVLQGLQGEANQHREKEIRVLELTPYLTKSVKQASNGLQEVYIRNFGDDFAISSVK